MGNVLIKEVDNGWIIEHEMTNYNEDGSSKRVVSVYSYDNNNCLAPEDQEVEAFKYVLYHINDCVGPSTNRHSPKRISITLEPGDKYNACDGEGG